MATTGQRFTWMNKREENEFAMERLDRTFASAEWINSYPDYALQKLPIVRSDHGPIILDFEWQHPLCQRPFRFEFMWLTHPMCKEVLRKAWNTHIEGSRAFKLKSKLLKIRSGFLAWNREVFGKVE